MRKAAFVLVGLLVTGAMVSAQDVSTAKVKKAKIQLTLDADLKVGAAVLKAGTYEVQANGAQLTFRHLVENSLGPGHWDIDIKQKPLSISCATTVLKEKSADTELNMPADTGGVHVLKTMMIAGSDVKYTIGN
jgi:hypothetical protein